jgi:integrase
VEQYLCERCGRELFHLGDDPPPTRCEDCIPETGQGSRLVDQVTINLRMLRSEAGIEREELARRAAMSADEIALAEREAAREPGVTRALRLAHSIGVSIDDLADRIYWNPGGTARSPEDRRPPSERLSGFFLVLPANVPIFDPPRRASVASREELAKAFGENVRSARERRHLFQKTLAHAAGLSREGLSYIERGIHETTIETMLSIARALQVLAMAPEQYKLLFEVLATTGLRISEGIALQRLHFQIDSATPEVCVRRAIVRGRVEPPKTKYGKREVRLPDSLVYGLRAHFAAQEDQDSTALAFTNRDGNVLEYGNLLRRHLKPLVEEVNAAWAGFHTFRHTFASLHLSRGTNLLQLSRALGHHSAAFTLSRYTHLPPGDEAPALDLDPCVLMRPVLKRRRSLDEETSQLT